MFWRAYVDRRESLELSITRIGYLKRTVVMSREGNAIRSRVLDAEVSLFPRALLYTRSSLAPIDWRADTHVAARENERAPSSSSVERVDVSEAPSRARAVRVTTHGARTLVPVKRRRSVSWRDHCATVVRVCVL